MHKYEIMLILDPKAKSEESILLVESIFKKENVKKAEKLERTDLAYPINGSLKAQYLLFEVLSESSTIAEFTRRSNITKDIWRFLVINLDSEKGYGKPKREFKGKKYMLAAKLKSEKLRQEKQANQGAFEKKDFKSTSFTKPHEEKVDNSKKAETVKRDVKPKTAQKTIKKEEKK